jgi:hypothetical protein
MAKCCDLELGVSIEARLPAQSHQLQLQAVLEGIILLTSGRQNAFKTAASLFACDDMILACASK